MIRPWVCFLIFFTISSAQATDKDITAFFDEIYDISETMSKTLEKVRQESFTQRCVNMSWHVDGFSFGQACQADQFGDVSRIDLLYSDYVLDQGLAGESEEVILQHKLEQRKNISALILQVVDYVVERRQPDMSQEERRYFKLAVLAKIIQESWLVHYRTRATPLKIGNKNFRPMMLLVGDESPVGSNHFRARGMMQINVAKGAHKLPLDVDFDIVKNLAYGVNYFLSKWNSVDSTPCLAPYKEGYVPGHSTSAIRYFMRRARLAYSGYNGAGAGMCKTYESVMKKWGLDAMFMAPDPTETKICPSKEQDRSAAAQKCRNYEGYFGRYMSLDLPTKQWFKHTQWESGYRVKTPVTEILQADDIGTLKRVLSEEEFYDYVKSHHRIYFNDAGEACRPNPEKGRMDCIQPKDFAMLDCVAKRRGSLRYGFASKGIQPPYSDDLKVYYPGKNELCVDNSKDLVPVGGFIQITRGYFDDGRPKGIAHRAVLGGTGTPEYGYVRSGEIYQVLDFNEKAGRRFYTVKNGQDVGYVFAGSTDDKNHQNYFGNWVQPISIHELTPEQQETIEYLIPLKGMVFEITSKKGLPYFRSKRTDTGKDLEEEQLLVERLMQGIQLQSAGFVVRGTKQEVFVKFLVGGEMFELYSGVAGGKKSTILESIEVLVQ